MPVDTNYFYSARIYKLIASTLRLFSDYYIATGVDSEGKPILRRVPVVYMSSDKSALTILNKASASILETLPKMVLALSSVKLNEDQDSGAVYEEDEVEVTEKQWNSEAHEYEYKPGNSYHIRRLNPVPLGLTFTLYILTTTVNQKLQLFEQIRAVYARELDLQTSENALDLCRLSTIRLSDVSWSSRGVSGLDSSQVDSMDMTFEVNAYLDLPALVTRQMMIEKIVTDIHDDIPTWSLEDVTRTYHTPNNARLKIYYDEEQQKQFATLLPNNATDNWFDMFKMCNILYNPLDTTVMLHCTSTQNDEHNFTFKALVHVLDSKPDTAWIEIDEDSLPSTNVKNVEAIIDPHHYNPESTTNMRYLLDKDLPLMTSLFGTIQTMDGHPYLYDPIPEGSIIEWYNGNWCVSLNPKLNNASYFLRNNETPQYLYTFNNTYQIWVDAINATYSPLMWKLSVQN